MAGLTNYLRNNLIDWLMRGQTFTPPTSVFIALVTTTPNAATAGTEVSGTGYARVEVPTSLTDWCGTQGAGSTSASSGTSGTTSNNADIDFGTAGGAWGTVTYWEAYDAVTSGNRLMWGAIVDSGGVPTPRSIANGDPVKFPTSALSIPWA
jgi:hypothetical protein